MWLSSAVCAGPRLFELLMLRPDVCHRHVEPADAAVQRVDQPSEPPL
jgi:hypothetical protein